MRSANIYGFEYCIFLLKKNLFFIFYKKLKGIMLGFTNSIMFYAMATAFVVGAIIVEKGLFGLTFQNIMLVFRYLEFNF